nr:hypothetical protein [Tanacetum cinerariifolium]
MGFDYEIAYKKGSDNAAADCLDCQSGEFNALLMSEIDPDLLTKVKESWANDIDLQQLIQKLVNDKHISGHSGVQASAKKLGITVLLEEYKDVKTFVRKCDICQRNKPNLEAYPRALQPLPIQDKVWQDVSMDFIDGLPSSHEVTEMSTFPLCDKIGLIVVEPQAVLDRRMQKKGDKAVVYVLVQWENETEADATWNSG